MNSVLTVNVGNITICSTFFNYTYPNQWHSGIVCNGTGHCVLGKCMPRTGVAVFRKDILKQIPFREDLRRYEDMEHLFRWYKVARFYRIKEAVFIYKSDGSAAKYKRKNIKDDFSAYLEINKGISWENIALYKLYLSACRLYPKECKKLYPKYSQRYFLYLITRIMTNRYIERIYRFA